MTDSAAFPSDRCPECGRPDVDGLHVQDPGTEQWLALLELTTAYMVATEALVEGLQGKLGVKTRQEAAQESLRRADAYQEARRALIHYAREMQAVMA